MKKMLLIQPLYYLSIHTISPPITNIVIWMQF
jgi:hypothetical protein